MKTEGLTMITQNDEGQRSSMPPSQQPAEGSGGDCVGQKTIEKGPQILEKQAIQ